MPPLERETVSEVSNRAAERDLHVETLFDEECETDLVVMRCGIVVTLDEDAIPTPLIDWVHPDWAERATCVECKR